MTRTPSAFISTLRGGKQQRYWMETGLTCTLSRPRYIRLLVLITLALVVLGTVKEIQEAYERDYRSASRGVVRLRALFDLNGEQNIPAWFSTLNLITCAALLTVIGTAKRREKEKFAVQWFILAGIFLFLGFDEAFAIHEELNAPLRSALGLGGFQLDPDATSLFYYSWVIPYGILTIIVGLLYIPLLLRLPARIRMGFVAAGFMYVTGALVLEMVEGWYQSAYTARLGYVVLYVTEEALELGGVVLFINSLLTYMRERWPVVSFCL